MLNVVRATEGQAKKITDKYFVFDKLIDIKCTYDDEDGDYFISAKSKDDSTVYFSYQVRGDGKHPIFFGMQKSQSRYDIHYPGDTSPELYAKLQVVSDKAIQDWIDGNHL